MTADLNINKVNKVKLVLFITLSYQKMIEKSTPGKNLQLRKIELLYMIVDSCTAGGLIIFVETEKCAGQKLFWKLGKKDNE